MTPEIEMLPSQRLRCAAVALDAAARAISTGGSPPQPETLIGIAQDLRALAADIARAA